VSKDSEKPGVERKRKVSWSDLKIPETIPEDIPVAPSGAHGIAVPTKPVDKTSESKSESKSVPIYSKYS
jgi:hypothetical protein